MELRHLRYFLTVAETGNFRRAAERLNISQPPLSTQIRQLEEEIGVQLFERASNGTFLTGPGRIFLDHVHTIMAQVETAKTDARLAAGMKIGNLRVGWTTSGDFISFMPQAIHRFREAHPHVSIQLTEMISYRQIEAVTSGALDIGIMRQPERELDDRLTLHEIWRDRLVLVVHSEDKLAQRRSVAIADLRDETFVAHSRDSGMGINYVLHAMCRNAGFVPRIAQEGGSNSIILGLVAAGIGIGLVPSTLRMLELHGLSFVPIEGDDATCSLCAVHRSANRDPLLHAFLASVLAFSRPAGG